MPTRYVNKAASLAEIGFTPNASGLQSFGGGVFMNVSGTPYLVGGMPSGNNYYVDANVGLDTNDGRSWGSSFLTMGKAFTSIASGDTIVFRGKIKEQLTTPVNVFDVTVIGAGNRPHHADSTPTGGQLAANTWTIPASPTTAPLVKVIQQGWRFMNILFAGPTAVNAANSSITLFRDAGAGDLERDASHAEIIGCRFASGYQHILDTGGCYGVKVADNRFVSHALWAILGVGNIGVGQSNWEIINNDFDSNAVATSNHVKIAGFACRITQNSFDDGGAPNTTVVLNTNNGGGDNNRVWENIFQTTDANWNSPDIVGAATDVWNQNYDFSAVQIGPT